MEKIEYVNIIMKLFVTNVEYKIKYDLIILLHFYFVYLQWCRNRFCVVQSKPIQSKYNSKSMQSFKRGKTQPLLNKKNFVDNETSGNRLSTLLFGSTSLTNEVTKYTPSNALGKWSEWSSYSQCEKSCKLLNKQRLSAKHHLTYSKFRGLKVSTRSCKIPFSINTFYGTSQGRARCIGPTHRYQECNKLKVCTETVILNCGI